MHRLKIPILAVIVVAMIAHLHFIGNKSIVKPIGYSGSIKMIEPSRPVNNVSGLKFPSSEEKKYIYMFVINEDKLDYKRYDIEAGKVTNINVPKNKSFFICTEVIYSKENSWSWYSDFINLELKGKFAKSVDEGAGHSVQANTPILKGLKGENYNQGCFKFLAQNIGVEKISLVYGNQIKDYIKIPININVE